MNDAKFCEQCGQNLRFGCRKRDGKFGWCSDTCLIRAGRLPKPTPKVFKKKNTYPHLPVYRGDTP